MFKRLMAILLSLALLHSAVPFAASAEETEDARIRTQIRRVYNRVRYATGRSSLNGYCGLMSSYQLWALGVTPHPVVFDGNNMYDYYATGEPVVNGYVVQSYPATEYSLEEALNLISHCGTRDVYNILVGFQRTNTSAGRRYGHAMVIHAILDGTVYFVEGFHTSIGGAEGNVLTCSISEFADFYNPWTTYEGLVVFGNKAFTDSCQAYATDMFAQAADKVSLLSLPCQLGANSCRAIRQTVPGEKLRVNELYFSDGQLYYRVQDGETVCYIPADDAIPFEGNSSSVSLFEPAIPTEVQPGEALQLAGTVYSPNSLFQALSVTVTGENGMPVLASELTVSGRMAELSIFNESLASSPLPEGTYLLTVNATVENACPEEGQIHTQADIATVWQSNLQVGHGDALPPVEPVREGWIWEDGCWYFYQDGQPRTGWYCHEGVDYYFLPNGAAATGWHEINGHWRCFTANGAMRTGWVETEQGMCFMLFNGAPAIGWRQVEGALYCFDENGLMRTEGTDTFEGATYTFMENGVAVKA